MLEAHQENGLNYVHRTSAVRYLSEDPIGFEGGDVNLYAYVGGNPINAVDPSGTCGPACGLAVVAGAGALKGLGSQAISDFVAGDLSGIEAYIGSAVGGATGALALIGLRNETAASAVGGAVGNATTQTIKIASDPTRTLLDDFSLGEVAASAGFSAVTDRFHGKTQGDVFGGSVEGMMRRVGDTELANQRGRGACIGKCI